MIFNYLKVACRYLFKNKVYSLINLIGLATGIAVSVLILLFVSHEMNYDKFHANESRIFRMMGRFTWGTQQVQVMAMSPLLGPVLKANQPKVENYVRVREPGRVTIQGDPQHRFFENGFIFTDTSFFSVFSFEVLQGNTSSLAIPGQVFITEKTAQKYFGHTQVIGKTLRYNHQYDLTVAGVVKEAPSNSSIQFDFIGSFESLSQIESEKDNYFNDKPGLGAYTTYLLLESAEVKDAVEKSIPGIVQATADEHYLLELQSSTHLNNNFGDSSNTRNIYIFSCIAVIILLLALVNYMNLTTARASVRAKEVGVRKVTGAGRLSLSMQFYIESAILTLGAFILALVMVELCIPLLRDTLQQRLDHAFIVSPLFIGILFSLLCLCIFISGSYPSLVLSRFKPVDVLKGKTSKGYDRSAWIRKGFTTFQFAVSMGLIICTLVVNDQLTFLRNQKLGLNKEQVMVMQLAPDAAAAYIPLKNALRQMSGVVNVATATISLYHGGHGMYYTKTPMTHEDVAINVISADEKFPETLGLSWIERPQDTTASGKYIINESAIEKLKIDGNPLGLKLALGNQESEIAGVVHDFNYTSLHSTIQGLVINIKPDTSRQIIAGGASLYIRLDPAAGVREQVAAIRATVEKYQPDVPFEFYFLDDAFNKLYSAEDRLASLFEVFTIIGIGIACLGLFGLVTFAVERRVKEMGIRKVLGASPLQIAYLLSNEFTMLFLASIVLAGPIAWWSMEQWLSKFPYRISISYGIIIMAALATFIVAWLTISTKALRASRINPVESLRSE
ncbi:MAG TPA: FtsX-like permease family protein [Ohtaekwangia sp.]|uniref:ABC transporter permease n=1 Tax=Ohtaekwangia sp. TaxID=2066019 RepID=UPI002F922E46